MSEEPAKPKLRVKICPGCNKEISTDRFVCPDCGYTYPWFKVRLYLGGCGVVFFFLSMLAYMLLSTIPVPEAGP